MKQFPFKRIILIVLDSVGIGEAPDAHMFGDANADTLGHIAEYVGGLEMPNMSKLGLSNIKPIKGIPKSSHPAAHFGKMQEASIGKDTLTGHWELMGLILKTVSFKTFPNGFDEELIQTLEEKSKRKVIGNKAASGTEIIRELGDEHVKTGHIIVYTSADSVLQIAAHEEIVPLDELYHICQIARELTKNEKYLIGRVIARPFIGKNGHFTRTANRKDFALSPFERTVLNDLKDAHLDVIAIGKVYDIFNGEGITKHIGTKSNDDGIKKLKNVLCTDFAGLAFVNLVDFDALYGHRRDPIGYAKALESFDAHLFDLLSMLKEDDLLIITADHGNDPTFRGTDHTREYVPLIVYHHNIKIGKWLGIRKTFADVGATIADNFQLPMKKNGESFLNDILKE